MLHLCPVGDPVLFLRLLGTKSKIEPITLGSADLHRAMLWHYPVVESSLEEPKLPGRQRERDITDGENQNKKVEEEFTRRVRKQRLSRRRNKPEK